MGELIQMFPPEPQSIHAKYYEHGIPARLKKPALFEYSKVLSELVMFVDDDDRQALKRVADRYAAAVANLAKEVGGKPYGV